MVMKGNNDFKKTLTIIKRSVVCLFYYHYGSYHNISIFHYYINIMHRLPLHNTLPRIKI